MDFKVGLTDEAIADLRSITEYIARDSAEAAAHVGHELIATAESLTILPHRGAPVKERRTMRKLTAAVDEGIRRIEDVASGRVKGLTEEEYRAALR